MEGRRLEDWAGGGWLGEWVGRQGVEDTSGSDTDGVLHQYGIYLDVVAVLCL